MNRKQVLLSERLETYKIFSYACFIDPAFAQKTRCSIVGKPYNRQIAKTILSFCHLKIVSAVEKKMPGTERLQGLDVKYLASPRALSLAIENDGLLEGMKRGSISLQDAINISRYDL